MRAKIKDVQVHVLPPMKGFVNPRLYLTLSLASGKVRVPLTDYGIASLFNSIWRRVPDRFSEASEFDPDDLIGKHVTYQRNEDNKIVLVERN